MYCFASILCLYTCCIFYLYVRKRVCVCVSGMCMCMCMCMCVFVFLNAHATSQILLLTLQTTLILLLALEQKYCFSFGWSNMCACTCAFMHTDFWHVYMDVYACNKNHVNSMNNAQICEPSYESWRWLQTWYIPVRASDNRCLVVPASTHTFMYACMDLSFATWASESWEAEP
jgi:hypothetical protein